MFNTDQSFATALAQHQAGNLQQAEQLYRQIIQAHPGHADAHHLLGVVAYQTGRHKAALASIRQALALNPYAAVYHSNLAVVLEALGQMDQVLATYQQALRLQPGSPETFNSLGNTLRILGRLDDAQAHCAHALKLRPNFPEAHNNLGNVYFLKQNLAEAVAHYQEALRQRPDYAEAHSNLGYVLAVQRKQDEALAHYKEALRIRPDYPEAHSNLAALYKAQGLVDEAAEHYRHALRLKPSNGQRIMLATLLPPIYLSVTDIQSWRQRLKNNLRELHEAGVKLDVTTEPAQPPFFLAYQGCNDRDIQRDVAKLFTLGPSEPSVSTSAKIKDGKIRLGLLSSCFRRHTIGHLMQGVVANLSREDFVVVVLSVGQYEDDIANSFKQSADHYVVVPKHLPTARRIIAEQKLDILFYTDIGMEADTYTLALSRLAPIQCTTWGHPLTTGIDTVDYFISSDALETQEAERHYTEKLVKLKTLPIYYYRPEQPSPLKPKSHFGLADDAHVYACPQSLFKLHPDFDEILAGILRGDPLGTLVLGWPQTPRWEQLLRQRFATTMPDVVDRIVFHQKLNRTDFLNLMAISDVLLDPVHFGGGNTSYEGLAFGMPIVTLPSQFLRGRITYALYKQMEFLDCVVHSPREYIDLALRLGMDAGYRRNVSDKILAANSVLYENATGIRELEQFFKQAVHAQIN